MAIKDMIKKTSGNSAFTQKVVKWMWLGFGGIVAFCIVMFILI